MSKCFQSRKIDQSIKSIRSKRRRRRLLNWLFEAPKNLFLRISLDFLLLLIHLRDFFSSTFGFNSLTWSSWPRITQIHTKASLVNENNKNEHLTVYDARQQRSRWNFMCISMYVWEMVTREDDIAQSITPRPIEAPIFQKSQGTNLRHNIICHINASLMKIRSFCRPGFMAHNRIWIYIFGKVNP